MSDATRGHLKRNYKKSYNRTKCFIEALVYLLENNILTLTLIDTGSHAGIFKI